MVRLGIHTSTRGWTDTTKAVADALQAECFLWMEQNRPQDALAYPSGTHIFRVPNPHVDESGGEWWSRVAGLVNTWVSAPIPQGALILQMGNEIDIPGYDLPVAWDIATWKARHTDYLDYIQTAHPSIGVLSAPFTCANTKALDANYVAPYQGIAVHCYWSRGNPGWRQGIDGGAAWLMATAYGKPVYITELGCNPQDAGEILAWLNEAHDQPLLMGMCLFLPDAAGTEFAPYDVSIEMAAAIRAGTIPPPVPDPPPPPEPQPMNPYIYDGDYAYQTFTRMVAGALSQKNPSVVSRENYLAVHAAAKQKDISVATLLGWIVAENVDPDLIAVNNLAGIYYVGQSRATPGPLGPASEGSKPYCAFATPEDFWTTLAINIATVDAAAWAWGDLRTIAREYTGGPWGEVKVQLVDALRNIGVYPHGSIDDSDAGSDDSGGSDHAPAQHYPLVYPVDAPVAQGSMGTFSHAGSTPGVADNGFYAIDFACRRGTPCRACADGTVGVIYTGDANPISARTGPSIWIDHDNGYSTFSCHMSRIDVRTGQRVVQGQTIGLTGDPTIDGGYAGDPPPPPGSDPHLHWEIWDTARHVRVKMEDLETQGIIGPWDGSPQEDETDMRVDGHMDDAKYAMQWHGPNWSFATNKPKKAAIPLNPGSGAYQLWKAQFDAGKPLGYALSKEMHNTEDTRFIQVFSNGNIEGNRSSTAEEWTLTCN